MIPWYNAVAADLRRRRHLFWHLPESQRSADLLGDLRSSLASLGSVSLIDCRHLPATPARDLDVQGLDLAADVVVLLDFCHLMTLDHGLVWLRQIRPPCMEVLDDGRFLLVVSQRPQRVYPMVDGSSLATDCPWFVFDWDRHTPDLEPVHRRDSCGFVSVGSVIDGWNGEHHQPQGAYRAALQGAVRSALLGCESSTVAWVTRNLCDSTARWEVDGSWRISSEDLPTSVVYDLTAAGLARLDHGTQELLIGDRVGVRLIKDAAVRADLSLVDPPREWTEAAKGLFTLERIVRRVVSEALESRPHLQGKLLAAYRVKASKNYKYETSARELDPPNLLQWIDLADVVELALDLAQAGAVGGMDVRQWLLLQRQLVPVRNRIMHVRLPEEGDLELVRAWKRRLRKGEATQQAASTWAP